MKSNKDECLFCRINPHQLVDENELCYAAKDSFPVTEFHTLIIPKRLLANYFDLDSPDNSVIGFNIGVNAGKYVHVYLIPSKKRDVEYSRGGAREFTPDDHKY